MNSTLAGTLCVLFGGGLAGGGYWLVKRNEEPKAGFQGVGLSRSGAMMALGYVLLIVGLVVAILISLLFFVG